MTRALWAAVIVLVAIGLATVVRRSLLLADFMPAVTPPRGTAFNAEFARHPLLTLVHILPGGLFMVLGPLQFVPRIRSRHIRFHRWSGRLLLGAGVVIGTTALRMAFVLPVGGPTETAATTVFGVIFLFSLGKAFLHVKRREIVRHREWMVRAFAVGLAVATVRPIVGLFFAFSDLAPQAFFGIAFWLGFTIHLAVAEFWIAGT